MNSKFSSESSRPETSKNKMSDSADTALYDPELPRCHLDDTYYIPENRPGRHLLQEVMTKEGCECRWSLYATMHKRGYAILYISETNTYIGIKMVQNNGGCDHHMCRYESSTLTQVIGWMLVDPWYDVFYEDLLRSLFVHNQRRTLPQFEFFVSSDEALAKVCKSFYNYVSRGEEDADINWLNVLDHTPCVVSQLPETHKWYCGYLVHADCLDAGTE